MRIHLKFIDREGIKHEVQGIWPSTSAAIVWAQDQFGALAGSAAPVWGDATCA